MISVTHNLRIFQYIFPDDVLCLQHDLVGEKVEQAMKVGTNRIEPSVVKMLNDASMSTTTVCVH